MRNGTFLFKTSINLLDTLSFVISSKTFKSDLADDGIEPDRPQERTLKGEAHPVNKKIEPAEKFQRKVASTSPYED